MFALILFFAVGTGVPLAGKILIIAPVVYAILQGLKKLLPAITGYWAIGLNVAFSIVGFVIMVPVDQLFTINTLLGLIGAIAASAGIHGTTTAMTKPT